MGYLEDPRASPHLVAVAMPGGSKYTSAYGWSTNPRVNYEAAKAKAQSCLHDPNPKLTALERAFWVALRNQLHDQPKTRSISSDEQSH